MTWRQVYECGTRTRWATVIGGLVGIALTFLLSQIVAFDPVTGMAMGVAVTLYCILFAMGIADLDWWRLSWWRRSS